MFLTPTAIEKGQCDSHLRIRAQDMNFEDMAIAFSQEEWEILDESQRRLYCNVMLEVFAFVSFVGHWHKMDDVKAYSEHSVSVGESQVRASKTAAATQRTHLCKPCFSVLKDILHLSELQVVYFEKNVFLSDACLRDLCFSANPHQQQKDASGEKPCKEDMERSSLGTSCCFYLSGVPAARTEVGEDSPAISGLLQHQATLNTKEPHRNNEISQECLSGKRYHQWVECETSASQKQKVAFQKGLCSGDMIYESNTCGKVFRPIFNHPQHGRVHTGEKPFECTDCGKVFSESTALIKHNRIHIREKRYKCSDCGKFFSYMSNFARHCRVHTGEKPFGCSKCGKHFRQRTDLIIHHRVHSGEKPYECSDCGKSFRQRAHLAKHQRVHAREKIMSVVNVKSPSVKELTSPHTTEFTLENTCMNVVIVGNPLVKVIASGNTREFTLVNVVSVVNVGNV
ncbi:zinc finger protein interacting with ribonucleoprotein K-like isoform X1 [Myotis daubentonii]|uniref:zinc finger protein interacting with ribonucleoprotein K-like isoform X1 n=1 Tax=Myotis daubentonii TaxID=98922 RepID=UPI002872EDBC|nr:zinc finger protein interacting with ribonucleoprotein K-like isoform X1 [Myotis daubentonii]